MIVHTVQLTFAESPIIISMLLVQYEDVFFQWHLQWMCISSLVYRYNIIQVSYYKGIIFRCPSWCCPLQLAMAMAQCRQDQSELQGKQSPSKKNNIVEIIIKQIFRKISMLDQTLDILNNLLDQEERKRSSGPTQGLRWHFELIRIILISYSICKRKPANGGRKAYLLLEPEK